ncbi:M91 family zinc metallopeptidase [Lacinutrix salivirga]
MAIRIRSRGSQPLQQRYEQSIQAVINDIQVTNTGRIVVRHLERSSRRVTISPYLAAGGNNASATPGNELSGGTFTADRIASGTGSKIAFSVERSTMSAHVPQGTADEVLLHEMSHALRQVTGTERLARVNGTVTLLPMASYENVEEFFAAMVASVHSSELGRALLGNHGSWPLRNPEVLNRPPFSTRLRQICERMPDFTRELAQIPVSVAPFNPFRNEIERSRVGVPNTFFFPNTLLSNDLLSDILNR